MNDNVIAIDLAKNVFHAVVLNPHGKEKIRRKIKRHQVLDFVLKQDVNIVVFEACGSAHHWGRLFRKHNLKVFLLPPQHVTAYLRGQKNDFNDALAIGEAYMHGRINSVPVKSCEQQTDQAFHRIRRLTSRERGDIVRQIRGFLAEFGLVVPAGLSAFRREVPLILEDAENDLTVEMRELIYRQYQRMIELDAELEWFNSRLSQKVNQDEQIKRLVSTPGFGPVVASAFKAWLGDGKQFSKGRDASAALGIVPRQHSSGGKNVLLGITKRGDCYLRSLIIHGARSVVRAAREKTDPLSRWINSLVERRGKNRATVALANKLVRIAWAITVKQEAYQAV
tara:strand:+ start:117 stop:1130 length:1014 start_codon:yes stop_codon:yes gene_type:complete